MPRIWILDRKIGSCELFVLTKKMPRMERRGGLNVFTTE